MQEKIEQNKTGIEAEPEWGIINPQSWSDPDTWVKTRFSSETQRFEVDPETKEEFVYIKKAGIESDEEEPATTIIKIYNSGPWGQWEQKKWYFNNKNEFLYKCEITYNKDEDGAITYDKETWFDKNNEPESEYEHQHDKNGKFTDKVFKRLK